MSVSAVDGSTPMAGTLKLWRPGRRNQAGEQIKPPDKQFDHRRCPDENSVITKQIAFLISVVGPACFACGISNRGNRLIPKALDALTDVNWVTLSYAGV